MNRNNAIYYGCADSFLLNLALHRSRRGASLEASENRVLRAGLMKPALFSGSGFIFYQVKAQGNYFRMEMEPGGTRLVRRWLGDGVGGEYKIFRETIERRLTQKNKYREGTNDDKN